LQPFRRTATTQAIIIITIFFFFFYKDEFKKEAKIAFLVFKTPEKIHITHDDFLETRRPHRY
jgi:hypothetical protein